MAGDRLVIGRGMLRCELDDGLARVVRRVLQNAAPRTLEAMERKAKQIHDRAQAEWPVRTGYSKSKLDYGTRLIGAGQVEAFVTNDADYAVYIKGREQGGKSTWVELLRKPGREAADELADVLRREMAAVVEGRR